MATETDRKLATKTFNTPGGNIKVPVITQITFQDPADRYQEITFTIDNSGNANRDIHVAWVAADPTDPEATENADPNATPPSGLIAVERIDQWRVNDKTERSQDTFTKPDNKTYNPSGPPFFTTHLKTHVVSYRKNPTDPNDTNLISSELIDEFVVVDPADRYQETRYILNNPRDNDEANAQITPDLPDITDTANGVDPPYRTDPFQNIVRLGPQPVTIYWAYEAIVFDTTGGGGAMGDGYHFRLIPGIPASPPFNITLADGRHGICTGNFPVVPDVLFGDISPDNFIAFPWWIVGPNTDSTTGLSQGYHYYDQPGGTFSHTWPFFGSYYPGGLAPAVFASAGQLSVTFGPVAFTVEGIPWTLTNIHAAMIAIVEEDHGGIPGGWAPFFSATFEPP